jgi:hypothetical protein
MGAMQTSSTSPAGARVSLDAAADAITATRRSLTSSRTSRAASNRSIASQLERDRLEQRAARVRQVIHALRERADARDTDGGAPRPLRAAIEDFGRELAELERRLHRAPVVR